jgi:hypothetical protein
MSDVTTRVRGVAKGFEIAYRLEGRKVVPPCEPIVR